MPCGGEHNWHTSSGLRDPGSTRSGHRDVPFINTQNLQSVFLYPGVYIVTDKLMRKIFLAWGYQHWKNAPSTKSGSALSHFWIWRIVGEVSRDS